MQKQKILCPVDYSSSSVPAVSLATKLAAADKSKVYLLHVNVPKDPISLDEAQVGRLFHIERHTTNAEKTATKY